MSSADDEQRDHNVPDALTQRLQTLIKGSDDWHEWHQAGVLMFQLATSAHLRFDMVDWHKDAILTLLDNADWLYTKALQALKRSAPDDIVARCAIRCDQELARAFEAYALKRHAKPEQFDGFFQIIKELTTSQSTPEFKHQLAIARGFLARASWWMHSNNLMDELLPLQALAHQAIATWLFMENVEHSPDGEQAYRSHLLAMALIHYGRNAKKWRRTYVWPAFWLALRHRDFKHAVRAMLIASSGVEGEKKLLAQRDTSGVYAHAEILMDQLWARSSDDTQEN